MTLSEYVHLKEQVILAAVSNSRCNEILNSLKELYRENIDSVRRFEQIKTIGNLVKVLEIRDVLSEDNVEPLKNIVRKLADHELLNKITQYEKLHIPREIENYYASKPNQVEHQREKYRSSNPLPNMTDDIRKQRIYQTVIEEIGSSWRDLGRSLRIRECEIDAIDFQNNNLDMKAKKLLDVFDSKADRVNWFFELTNALEHSRRKNLARSIQKIMTMNI